MVNTEKFIKAYRRFSTTIGVSGVANDTVQTIPLSLIPAVFTDGDPIEIIIDRVSITGTLTTDKEETIVGIVSGSNVITADRGVEGTAQAHSAGAVVEIKLTADMWNRLIEGILVQHSQDGSHTLAALESAIAPGAAGEVIMSDGEDWISGAIEAGASFWNDLPAAATRVSDTQFTLPDVGNAGKYDLLFKKGVILKWMESTTFQTAMVISSSYSSDVVTINIVGDSLTAGFTDLKYAMAMAQCVEFLCPGNQGVDTDVSKAWFAPDDIYKLSVDAYVSIAGTTNATTYDLNDDGTTIITTKPSIASGATSDLDNVCDAPSTVIAKDSKMTVDRDAASTTNAIDGLIRFWYYPASWRYR